MKNLSSQTTLNSRRNGENGSKLLVGTYCDIRTATGINVFEMYIKKERDKDNTLLIQL